LGPWWNYFLGMLVAAYKEFEARVGTITSSRGAKRKMVQRAVDRLPENFRIQDLRQACPGVSYPTLQRALSDMRKAGGVECLGRGPHAEWRKVKG
ncbi:MAG: cell filamentation protein Fic, partial [Deltaproteobacteria bacterium]|nr:cell filamentation protein Fic [Deltaproteobacteria bacterium]